VREDSGRVIARSVLPTEGPALTKFVRGMRGAVHVALEEGTQAQWPGSGHGRRGAVVMSAGVVTATLLRSLWPACYRQWPASLRSHRVLFGLLLALGFVAGELPNSFIKRQFDIEPGRRRISPLGIILSILDQADFVPVVWLTLSPLWLMSPVQALVVFVAVVIGHSMIHMLGYAIGARQTLT
jgi:CDP-diglyceride synthetase